ncbi:MAG: hypothetical protein O2897_03885 [bacterium]|nr:hypothetical protein [bacterium]
MVMNNVQNNNSASSSLPLNPRAIKQAQQLSESNLQAILTNAGGSESSLAATDPNTPPVTAAGPAVPTTPSKAAAAAGADPTTAAGYTDGTTADPNATPIKGNEALQHLLNSLDSTNDSGNINNIVNNSTDPQASVAQKQMEAMQKMFECLTTILNIMGQTAQAIIRNI